MDVLTFNQEFQGMDIALLDQVLKGRFVPGSRILDAGCGGGRNLFWFLNNGFDVFGIDQAAEAVRIVRERIAAQGGNPDHFQLAGLEAIPFPEEHFDLVICNAVLHFARDPEHFSEMFAELVRVLSLEGTLFIRMTPNIGMADRLNEGNRGVYLLPDGSHRFLLTRELLAKAPSRHGLSYLEPLKTVNVDDLRCMSTLVLKKN